MDQREKDLEASEYDIPSQRRIFADGAEYARKELFQRLHQIDGFAGWLDVEALAKEYGL